MNEPWDFILQDKLTKKYIASTSLLSRSSNVPKKNIVFTDDIHKAILLKLSMLKDGCSILSPAAKKYLVENAPDNFEVIPAYEQIIKTRIIIPMWGEQL